MKKLLIRAGIGIVAVAAVVLAASIYFIGSIVKKGIETVGPRVTQVEVKLDSADVWLVAGRAQLKGLTLGNPTGYKSPISIKVGDVSVRLKTRSVLSDKIIIDSVEVKSPEITIEGGLKKNNLAQIEKNMKEYGGSDEASTNKEVKPASAQSTAGRKFQVNEILISGARVHLASLFATGASVTIPLPDIHLSNLGTDPAGITAPAVAQKVLAALLSSIAKNAAEAIGNLEKSAVKELDPTKVNGKLQGLFSH